MKLVRGTTSGGSFQILLPDSHVAAWKRQAEWTSALPITWLDDRDTTATSLNDALARL